MQPLDLPNSELRVYDRPFILAASAMPIWSVLQPDGETRITAQVGPYQLTAHVMPLREHATGLSLDALVQHPNGTPAHESVLFVRITPAADAGRTLYSLVSMADGSSNFHHQATARLDEPGAYRINLAVCDPNGAGGEISIPWLRPQTMLHDYAADWGL
jgi:hypothetical protein